MSDNGNTALATRQQQETALAAQQQQAQLARVGSGNPLAIGPAQWNAMQQQAKMFVDSGFLPASIKTAAQAIAIVVTGYELGIPAMTALRTIHIVQGRPTLSAVLMGALIQKAHGDDALVLASSDDKQATYKFKRRGWADYTSYTYTIEMAQKAGLAGKDTWKGHPAAMLRARCISSIATANFQDVTLGLYTPEELGAPVQVFDSGEIRYDPAADPNVVNSTSRQVAEQQKGVQTSVRRPSPRKAEYNRLVDAMTPLGVPDDQVALLFALHNPTGKSSKDMTLEEVQAVVAEIISSYSSFEQVEAALGVDDAEEGEFEEEEI